MLVGVWRTCAEVIKDILTIFTSDVTLKLGKLGEGLQKWSHQIRRDRSTRKKYYEKRLNELLDHHLDDNILTEIAEVQLGMNLEADKEERYQEQLARVNWLVNGDRNTSFFHKVASARKKQNKVVSLGDNSGKWVVDDEGMLNAAFSYFAQLFIAS